MLCLCEMFPETPIPFIKEYTLNHIRDLIRILTLRRPPRLAGDQHSDRMWKSRSEEGAKEHGAGGAGGAERAKKAQKQQGRAEKAGKIKGGRAGAGRGGGKKRGRIRWRVPDTPWPAALADLRSVP